jgi:hypothetical protein
MRLCDATPAYLRRLEYCNREGASVAVYATEPLGHSIVRQVLGRAPAAATEDVKAQFLEHTVRLNDLYVALAEGCARQRVSPSRYPFWGISTESAGLPWQEQNGRTGRVSFTTLWTPIREADTGGMDDGKRQKAEAKVQRRVQGGSGTGAPPPSSRVTAGIAQRRSARRPRARRP